MRPFALLLMMIALAGCEATAEDIERWKGTQRGPAKLTAVIVEGRYSFEMRGRAAVALVEIAGWDHFGAAMERLSENDRREVVHALVPRLQEMYNSGVSAGQEGPTDAQVNAKDAMYDVYDWASPEDQAAFREQLLHWVTSDFNGHYLPGRRNIALIVQKVGPPATTALSTILTPPNTLIASKVTELIREHGDEESKTLASAQLAKTAGELGDRIRSDFWRAMAAVCGDPARSFALEFAGQQGRPAAEQVNALRCVLEGAPPECRPGCARVEDVDRILDVAENRELSAEVRAAAYDAARAKATPEHVERFLKMLSEDDVRYKATGIDIAIHVSGAKVAPTVLERLGAEREPWPWLHKEGGRGPEYGFCNMGLGLLEQAEGIHDVLVAATSHSNAFVRAGAANMLGIVGTDGDVPHLERLAADRGRVKGWSPDTVGAQARQAIERIRAADRPADVSARRGQACGL